MLSIEIVYASKSRQFHQTIEIPENSTVQYAIENSSILTEFPEIELAKNAVGIFSKKVTLSTPLHNGDRIEIYRPLTLDPMQKRRRIAETQRKQKQ